MPVTDSLLILDAKLKAGEYLVHVRRHRFVLIWSNFRRLFQHSICLLLECSPLRRVCPMIPVCKAFPGANHNVDGRVFNGAQGLSGNIALGMDSHGAKLLHSLVKLFFLARFNFSLNKDLDGHDRSSVISERDFKISMLWPVKKSTSSSTGTGNAFRFLGANCIPFWIAASDSSEPSIGSRICLNIVTSCATY